MFICMRIHAPRGLIRHMASAYPTLAEVDPSPRRHGEDQKYGAPPSPRIAWQGHYPPPFTQQSCEFVVSIELPLT